MKLTPPQRRFLRSLNHPDNSFGISTSGRWAATGRALVSRGLAEEKQPKHFTITEAGKQDCAHWAAGGFVH